MGIYKKVEDGMSFTHASIGQVYFGVKEDISNWIKIRDKEKGFPTFFP